MRLSCSNAAAAQVREVFERAIANVPPAPEKRYWQRYIYLWVRYALWEELDAQDVERAREVYRACLGLIPHASFTFAKVGPPCMPASMQAFRLPATQRQGCSACASLMGCSV
jgi:crooked neck